jgi:hypothetical protein
VPVPPVPVARELTPDPDLSAPAGFTVVDEPLVDGLPHRMALGADLTAVLTVPTGQALTWRDTDPTERVSSGEDGLLPAAAPEGGAPEGGAVDRPPARLFVLRGDEVLGSVPLVLGRRARVSDDGLPPGVQLEIALLSWDVRAGTLRGPGDVGARLSFAWRRAGASDVFTPPPVHPRVQARGALTAPGGPT